MEEKVNQIMTDFDVATAVGDNSYTVRYSHDTGERKVAMQLLCEVAGKDALTPCHHACIRTTRAAEPAWCIYDRHLQLSGAT